MDNVVPGPIVFRGRTYPSVDEMPAEVRQAYEQVLKMLHDVALSGTPDAWEERLPDEDPPFPRPAAGAYQE